MIMDKAGTGGALFRNLYRDFLKEADQLIGLDYLREGYERFTVIAAKWTEVSALFSLVADTESEKPLNTASELLIELSDLERVVIQHLSVAIRKSGASGL